MKVQLIMLEQPILVSDEKILEGDYVHNMTRGSHAKYQGHGSMEWWCKVIAGIPELPMIDFSFLSEEDYKKIGRMDAEEILKKQNWDSTITLPFNQGFIKGFEVSKEMNEKKFSIDDIYKAMAWAVKECEKAKEQLPILDMQDENFRENFIKRYEYGVDKLEDFIQSLYKPKTFDVEAVIEYKDFYGYWYLYQPEIAKLASFEPLNLRAKIIKIK